MSHKFVKFPKMWRVCLAEMRASGSEYRVALFLLDQATWSEYVPIGNQTVEKHGVSRAGKWRALERFRRKGLIAVEERPGRPPKVKVRWAR